MAGKKPEWLRRLEEAIEDRKRIWNDQSATNIANHLGHDINDPNGKIHRGIYVSTVSPTNADGQDGDIWITYKA